MLVRLSLPIMFALLNTTFKKEIVALEKLSKKMSKIEQRKNNCLKTFWKYILKLSETAAHPASLSCTDRAECHSAANIWPIVWKERRDPKKY